MSLLLLLIMQVRVVVLDPTLPRAWVESLVWESQVLHGQQFLPTRYRRDPLQGRYMAWGSRTSRLILLRKSKLHQQMRKRNAKIFYLLGPTSEGYLGGAAYVGKEISIGFAKQLFSNGNDASAHVVTLITHEVGHMRCANHVTSETLMNTLALGFVPQTRAWDPVSISEIANCDK